MELKQRKLEILACVVNNYIQKGEPVGSKSIAADLNLSSATIRSEMSKLEEMGYLTQPHTSAGRVPTRKGFRLYIDKLMNRYHLTQEDKKQIRSMLPRTLDDPKLALEQICSALAELTRCAAISTTDVKSDRVRRIELIPVGGYSVLLILLTELGVVKSRICKCSFEPAPQRIEPFLNFANLHFAGKELSGFQPAALQTIAASLGSIALENMFLLTAVYELVQEASEAEVKLEGSVNLLGYQEFTPTKAKELLGFLTHSNEVLSILSRLKSQLNVVLGDESNVKELDSTGMVVARYYLGDQALGIGNIGVIGPIRMDYEHIIPSIEYMARLLNRLYSDHTSSQPEHL